MLTTRFCSDCRADSVFERPPCADDHGVDCPEWICVNCGFAIVVGAALPDPLIVQTHAA